jgi:hypothetical protein
MDGFLIDNQLPVAIVHFCRNRGFDCLGNCRTKALLAAFEGIWLRIEARLRAGERIIEIR